jgi:hypothetical protein
MIADVAIITTAANNFPENRGAAIGMCKALIGLSGALLTQVYRGFFEPDAAGLLLFLVIEVSVFCAAGAYFTRKIPADLHPLPAQVTCGINEKGVFVVVINNLITDGPSGSCG